MSHKACHWALQQRPATSTEKWVLNILADYHNNETGLCFPSATTLATISLLDEKTVRRAMKSLEDQGFIIRRPRPGTTAQINFCWRRTPDTMTGVDKSALHSALEITASDCRNTTPDTMTGVDQNDHQNTLTPDIDDHHPGHTLPSPRTLRPSTPDTMPDEPGINLELTGKEEASAQSFVESWVPSKLVIDAIAIRFGKGFKIPDVWFADFRVYADGKGFDTCEQMNKSFIKWAPLQRGEEMRLNIQTSYDETPKVRKSRFGLDKPMSMAEMLEAMPIAKEAQA